MNSAVAYTWPKDKDEVWSSSRDEPILGKKIGEQRVFQDEELLRAGFRCLCEALGVAAALRFIDLSSTLKGDYVEASKGLLKGRSIDDIKSEIEQMRTDKELD